MAERCPTAFPVTPDTTIFNSVRGLLVEMANSGNAASKDHERMIRDIEQLFNTDSLSTSIPGGIDDIFGWSEFLEGNMGAQTLDQLPSLV